MAERERVTRLDRDFGYPAIPTETPDYLRMFYAARRLLVRASRRQPKIDRRERRQA